MFGDSLIYVRKMEEVGSIYGEISLSHAMRLGLQIRHLWVAKSLFFYID